MSDRPDRKTAVVTGTTSGIGAELAVLLAGRGYDLALVNRSAARTRPVVDRIRDAAPDAAVAVYEADLADPERVRAAAAEVLGAHPAVHALFNNAGVLLKDTQRTAAGREMHLAVNVLAPYLLTVLLRPALAAGAKGAGRAVVVTASSNAVFMTHRFDPARLDDPSRTGIFGAYAQSKLAASVLTHALAPGFARDGVELYAVDPGGTRTAMTAGPAAPFFVRWMRSLLPGPEKGAANLLAPLGEAYRGRSGLLISGGKEKRVPKGGAAAESEAAVLALCRDLTGVAADATATVPS